MKLSHALSSLVLLEEGVIYAMTSVFSWQNSISLCPASFCITRPNLPVTPGVSGENEEEIPLIQGKEQRLRFARVAVKRYPTSKVRETQVRQ